MELIRRASIVPENFPSLMLRGKVIWIQCSQQLAYFKYMKYLLKYCYFVCRLNRDLSNLVMK